MERKINKILPNGNPSGLSLNQFKIYRTNNSKWNGFIGKDIYSIKLFKNKFFELYPEYEFISNFNILNFIENNYKTDIKIWHMIEELVDGLANIILSIYEGTSECKKLNENLFDADWEFWKKCEYIVLDGKIISKSLGNEFIELLSKKLKQNLCNIKILRLCDFVDANIDTPSLLGCCCLNKYDKQYVFDFGNTTVKRGMAIRNNEKIKIQELNSIAHEDFWNFSDSIDSAKSIDKFITNSIIKTIYELDNNIDESINISLCLANNILNNKISNRGSYRFLRMLDENYNNYLSKKISGELNRKVNLTIYNDAEAVGNIFYNFSPNTAVITLGTLFGIAYPPKK